MELTQTTHEIKRHRRNIASLQRGLRRLQNSYKKYAVEDKIEYREEMVNDLTTLKAFLELDAKEANKG